MRKPLIATAAVVGALAAAVIAPTVSNAAAPTTVTFVVTGGVLDITAPSSQALTVAGNQATGTITGVKVTDNRLGIAGWVASAISTDFTKTAPVATVPATGVSYLGSVAAITGTAVIIPPVLASNISTTQAVQTATATVGANTATWNGAITVTLPGNVTAGSYSGTITHSVV